MAGNGIFQAMREDFLATQFSDNVFEIMDLDAVKLYGLNAAAASFSGSGNLYIRYDGTLFLEEGETAPAFLLSVPAVLPVPMLALGFAAIFLFGWRRKQRIT